MLTDLEINYSVLDRLRAEYHMEQILQLDRNCFGGKAAWNKIQFLFELPGKWELSVLAKWKNEIQGFAVASCFKNQFVHLHRIAVRKDSQGTGIGMELMKQVEEVATTHGLTTFTLECPHDLQVDGFYRSIEFQSANEEFTQAYLGWKNKEDSAALYLPLDESSRRVYWKPLRACQTDGF